MKEYSFTIYVKGKPITWEMTEKIAESLDGKPDVFISTGPDGIEFTFDREAENAEEALISAYENIDQWGYEILKHVWLTEEEEE